jgi:penicillin amidase
MSPLLIIALAGCAQVRSVTDLVLKSQAERLAQTVTIHRDGWGVPHIVAPTDAAVVFGIAYAQAEDNFWQVEEDLLHALGRAASIYGEAGLAGDLVRAAFEVERLSRDEYEREPKERRALWDAYAEGLNYWLETHPEVRPHAIARFEPWYVFARYRSVEQGTVVDGVRAGDVVATLVSTEQIAGPRGALPEMPERPDAAAGEGSNAWAVAPSRTANGHALLFQNPHVGFFGAGQRWEVHVRSGSGWHVSGAAILGTPVPREGHSEHLGWAHTATGADAADAWILDFGDAANPLAYRSGDGWRDAVEWEDTIVVGSEQGIEARRYRFRKTHLGPVIRMEDGRMATLRMARFEEGGALQQWFALGRARTIEEFRAALAQAAFPGVNTMYADTAGNIFHLHGNAVPRRSEGVDPSGLLNAADPRTEWQGYHEVDELPQLLNPESGWLQNTNGSPFLATAEGANLRAEDYPAYMAPEPDNARARTSRRILETTTAWTFEAWAAAAFETRVDEAAQEIVAIVDEWERLGAAEPGRTAGVDAAVEMLRQWDGVSRVESEAATLYFLWSTRVREQDGDGGEWPRMGALEEAVRELKEARGTSVVAWGEMNRLQRSHTGDESFNDQAPSLPIAGGPGETGIIFAFSARPGPSGRRYGVSGHSWVGIVELGDRPTARTIVTFGQSADPESPHWFDQAPLYARGELKQAWFWPEDVERWAQRSYRPGPVRAPLRPQD